MDSAASRAFLRSRFGWLLALVLLLPLAQTFAARHLLSHAQTTDAARSEGSYAVHQSVCDICLTAAAVGGGALPAALPDFALTTPVGASPANHFHAFWFADLVRAYESRAPPFVRY